MQLYIEWGSKMGPFTSCVDGVCSSAIRLCRGFCASDTCKWDWNGGYVSAVRETYHLL